MTDQNNIIPLYINSLDRTSATDSTTNFTIALRKDLRNVHSLSVSKVAIPNATTIINVNNNNLGGYISVSGVSTPFDIEIDNGNYTETTLASELNTKFNANNISALFGLVWTIGYDTAIERITMSVVFPGGGILPSWSIAFEYSVLVDFIGIGSGGTTTQTFTAPTPPNIAPTSNLNILCLRKPTTVYPVAYSITSNELTQSINTSYVASLAKNFTVSSSNNTIGIDATMTISNINEPIALGTGAIPSAATSSIVAMSSDGNIVACAAPFSGFVVFTRDVGALFWQQQMQIISNGFDGASLALSADGNTIAVGAPTIDGAVGATFVYVRSGYTWLFQQKLVGSGNAGASQQGKSVALSADGNTLAIGGDEDNFTLVGATWVFVRTGLVWAQQGVKLVGPGGTAPSRQGAAVALSADGNTLAVGGPLNNGDEGCVWVFVRSGVVWSFVNRYVGSGGSANAQQGFSVSVSPSGNTIAFGGPNDTALGATWIFEKSGLVWVQQGAKIVGSSALGSSAQGSSVALANGGDTLAVGGFGDDTGTGATWIHTRTLGVWTQQQKIVSATTAFLQQGNSVSMSSDGSRLVVGGNISNLILGAADIFEYGVSTYNFYQSIPATGAVGLSAQGSSVALSADGLTLASCGAEDDSGRGAIWMYERQGLQWIQKQKLVSAGIIAPISPIGSTVAISSDGTIVVFGMAGDNNGVGATWIFVKNSGGVWIQQQKLVSASAIGAAAQGSAVAIFDSFVVVGAPSDDFSNGAVFVYEMVGGIFVEQQKLIGSGGNTPSNRGISVGVSSNTIIFGGNIFNIDGAVWVFENANSSWSEQVRIDAAPATDFGRAVSLSGNGLSMAVSGLVGVLSNTVFLYRFGVGGWTQEFSVQKNIVAFGTRLALNFGATSLIVGSPNETGGIGAIYLYSRTNGLWSNEKRKTAIGYDALAFGTSVSSSANLEYVVGAPLTGASMGGLSYIIDLSTLDAHYDLVVATGTYTVFDFTNVLSAQLDAQVSLVATFDGLTYMSLAGVLNANLLSFKFSTSASSTFGEISWPTKTKLVVQKSGPIDFTINNNVMKIILNTNSPYLMNSFTTIDVFRKYPPGFTIPAGTLIDIQLRDERDRIIDLNGVNWFIEILATILS
jgi:hypothetical protein